MNNTSVYLLFSFVLKEVWAHFYPVWNGIRIIEQILFVYSKCIVRICCREFLIHRTLDQTHPEEGSREKNYVTVSDRITSPHYGAEIWENTSINDKAVEISAIYEKVLGFIQRRNILLYTRLQVLAHTTDCCIV